MSHILQGTWDEIKTREQELNGHRLLVIVDPARVPNPGDEQEYLENSENAALLAIAADCCALRRAKLLDALSW